MACEPMVALRGVARIIAARPCQKQSLSLSNISKLPSLCSHSSVLKNHPLSRRCAFLSTSCLLVINCKVSITRVLCSSAACFYSTSIKDCQSPGRLPRRHQHHHNTIINIMKYGATLRQNSIPAWAHREHLSSPRVSTILTSQTTLTTMT